MSATPPKTSPRDSVNGSSDLTPSSPFSSGRKTDVTQFTEDAVHFAQQVMEARNLNEGPTFKDVGNALAEHAQRSMAETFLPPGVTPQSRKDYDSHALSEAAPNPTSSISNVPSNNNGNTVTAPTNSKNGPSPKPASAPNRPHILQRGGTGASTLSSSAAPMTVANHEAQSTGTNNANGAGEVARTSTSASQNQPVLSTPMDNRDTLFGLNGVLIPGGFTLVGEFHEP